MALTAADTLTEQHRRAQMALRALAIRQLLVLWGSLDVTDVARTWPPLLQALKLLIFVRRQESSALAARYYRELRRAEGIPGTVVPRIAERLADDMLDRSLGFTGPVTLERHRSRPDASERALVATTGAVTRHVLDGGRETLAATIEDDDRAIGYVRITDDDPCAWCAMLASRGVVYKSRASALATSRHLLDTEERKTHDNCGCTIRPMYRDATIPASNQRWKELWASSTQGKSGDDARIAFRRALEGR